MNLLQIISDLKQIAAECEKVTSGNVSHRIKNIEHGILNIADYLENYCPLGWHPASELPPIKENGKSEWLVSYVECDNDKSVFLRDTVNVYYDSETKTWLDVWGDIQCVEWWSVPPKKEGEL